MNPNQPQLPQQNPYSFITDSGPAPKKSLLPGGSMKGRIIVVAGLLVGLILLFAIASALLSSGGKGTVGSLKNIIAKQEELIRVAQLGVTDAASSDAKNFAQTVSLTLQTDQAQALSVLSKSGGKISKVEQTAAKSDKTDQDLEAAKSTSYYDETMREIITTQLNSYLAALKSTYDSTDGPTTKEVLSTSYTHASTLLGPSQANQ